MTQRTPFKFLDAYTQADRDIFCGRDADIEELHARALQNRLLLVYGPSGVGKTSLIQCGLMNKFPSADRLPLTVRYDGNLFAALDRAIAALTKTPVRPDTTLTEKLHALYFEYFTPITLIFDQLEELFIFGAADERERFAAEIAALLDAPFKLRILFVIREEYLAELTAFEAQLPDLFANRLRVERMSHANARRAIEEPCAKCGVIVEEGLPEQIIARLGASKSGAVELTYLQVVLDKLYARGLTRCADTGGAISLTVADVNALGDIGDILGAFLSEQLAALPREQAALGEAILKTLVTPDGTKKALNAPEIADALPGMGQTGDQAEIAAILNHFAAVRLLSEKEESGRYELRHDSLAQKIFERMTALEKDLLEVMQTIENRYKEYQKRGTFLDNAALQYVAPYESRLRFNPELVNFIGDSKRELNHIRRKRRIALTAAVIAVFIVVAGAGVFSYLKYREADRLYVITEEHRQKAEQQTKIAKEQREIAKQQKGLALEAIRYRTYQFVDELAKIPQTAPILNRVLSSNIELLDKIAELNPDTTEAQKEKEINLLNIGDSWLLLGNTKEAIAAYQEAHEIAKRFAKIDPAKFEFQRDLSNTYEKIGDVQLKLGDINTALIAYQLCLDIRKHLSQKNPTDIQVQKDLALSYSKLGNMQLEVLGDTQAALDTYQQHLIISRQLVQAYPTDLEVRRMLSVVYEHIGIVQTELSNIRAARTAYNQCIEIRRHLVQTEPNNTEFARYLSASYIEFGDLERQLGNTESAMIVYQKALEISNRLEQRDPNNTKLQRDVLIIYSRIGLSQEILNNHKAALQSYQEALRIARELAKDSLNQEAQQDLEILQQLLQ